MGLDEVAASIELHAGETYLAGSVLYFQHQPTAQAQLSKRRGDMKSTNLSDLMVHARQRDASADDVVAVRCDEEFPVGGTRSSLGCCTRAAWASAVVAGRR